MLKENLHPVNRAATQTLKKMGLQAPADQLAILKLMQEGLEREWVDLRQTERELARENLLQVMMESVECGDEAGVMADLLEEVSLEQVSGDPRRVTERLWESMHSILMKYHPSYPEMR